MKIQIYHATAGQGHKKIAEVLAEAFKKRGLSAADVQVYDSLELSPGFFGKIYPFTYFFAVKNFPGIWGWFYESLDIPAVYAVMRPFRSLHNWIMGRKILEKVKNEKPDFLFCTHFYTAELFASARKRGEIQSTLITLVTDFFPHTFWVNEGTDRYWVMGEEGKRDLEKRGIPSSKITAGGIPVAEAFKPLGKKQEYLRKWNFSADRLTLLLTSGSFGLGCQEKILRHLETIADKVQCFVVCGNNETLQKSLKEAAWKFPIQIFGFIDFMPELMEASDLILAKSGGSTTTESLAKGLPMVIMDPIPGQETRNAALLTESGAAFCLSAPEQILPIVNAVLNNPSLLKEKKMKIAEMAKPNAADALVEFTLSLSSAGTTGK